MREHALGGIQLLQAALCDAHQHSSAGEQLVRRRKRLVWLRKQSQSIFAQPLPDQYLRLEQAKLPDRIYVCAGNPAESVICQDERLLQIAAFKLRLGALILGAANRTVTIGCSRRSPGRRTEAARAEEIENLWIPAAIGDRTGGSQGAGDRASQFQPQHAEPLCVCRGKDFA